MWEKTVTLSNSNIDTAVEKYSISEHNALIEWSYKLNKYELKILWLLSSFVKIGDKDLNQYQFPVKGLMKYLWLANSKHQYLKEIIDNFVGKKTILPYFDEDSQKEREITVVWISSADYQKDW